MLLLGTTAAAQGSSPGASTAGPIVVAAVEPKAPLTSLWNGDIGGSGAAWTPRIDGDGRIWTSPVGSNGFRVFDPDGTLIEEWGTAGSGDGELRSGGGPHALGIAFAPDGGFYVADAGNRRIQRFDKDRQFVRSFGSFGTADDQFVSPIELALDGAENVYVFDDELGTIKEFTADGGFVRSMACGGPFLGVTPDGTVLAFDNASGDGVLNRCGPDGSVVPWLDLSSMVGFGTGIVVDDDGSLWIASTTSGDDRELPQGLLHLDADGKVLARWEVPAEGFDVDPGSGRLYTAYWRQPSLGAYELTGE
jgi:sugar lactone lactonase YvrE